MPLHPQPSAEVILRVQLADTLGADDLARLAREADDAGSLEAAVIRVLRRGLAQLTTRAPSAGGAAPTPPARQDASPQPLRIVAKPQS